MSQILTLELPEHVYKVMQQAAEEVGQTPAEWATQVLVQHLPADHAEPIQRETHPQLYHLLQQLASTLGQPTEELVTEWHAKYGAKPRPHLSKEEKEVARQRLMRHAGAADLGYPTGADNESIDADLAQEYASTLEAE